MDNEIVVEVDDSLLSPETTPELCGMCGRFFDYDPNSDDQIIMIEYSWSPDAGRSTKDHYICEMCTDSCRACGETRLGVTNGNYFGYYFHSDLCYDCSENYSECERCQSVHHNDDVYNVNGDYLCSSCCSRVAIWCGDCDQYEYSDSACSPHDENIHTYSYKPQPAFHGVDEDNPMLHFGFELEVEARRGDLSEGTNIMVDGWGDFVYLKEDSSIDFGFEIVTHPATLSYLQNEVDWNVIKKLRDIGFRSWDTHTCGLHVHIDRRAFRDRTHIMAMSYLLNNNGLLSQRIAGRNSDYGRIGNSCKNDNVHTLKGYTRGRGGERYMAINLQNSSTIEIRMFKGSLKVERILSAIEYCHAIVVYSKNIRSGIQAKDMLRPEEFASWIRKQGKYPNLVQYLPDFEPSNTNEMEE